MSDMLYIVRSKTGCPSCVEAKKMLAERGIEYVEEIYDDFDERQAMYDSLGLVGRERTVPQIELRTETHIIHIRGAEALEATLKERDYF